MTFWTEERAERCRTLWAEGVTASAIGAEIGTTRNSVLSKIHRSGWTGANSYGAPGATTQRVERAKNQHRSMKRLAAPGAPRPVPVAVNAAVSSITTTSFAENGPKGLLELLPGDCRWPINDAPDRQFAFCAAPRANDQDSYCVHHNRVAVDGRRSAKEFVPWRRPASQK